jgi:hypothetical protein
LKSKLKFIQEKYYIKARWKNAQNTSDKTTSVNFNAADMKEKMGVIIQTDKELIL